MITDKLAVADLETLLPVVGAVDVLSPFDNEQSEVGYLVKLRDGRRTLVMIERDPSVNRVRLPLPACGRTVATLSHIYYINPELESPIWAARRLR